MTLSVQCPKCAAQYRLKDELAGRKAKCNKCGGTIEIPAAASDATPPVAASLPAASSAAPPAPAAGIAVAKATPAAAAPASSAPAFAARQAPPSPASVPPAGQSSPAARPAAAPGPAPAPTAAVAPSGAPARVKCPNCDSMVEPSTYCSVCGLHMTRRAARERQEETLRRKESREWMYMAIGIVAALGTAPVFFLVLAAILGPLMALLICQIEVNLIVAIGSFSLACRIFDVETPEPGEMLKIIGWSSVLGNAAASWLFGSGWLVYVTATVLAFLISSAICMFGVQMPVWHSLGVCLSYNIFATVLTVVAVVMLVVLFAGWFVATGGGVPDLPRDSMDSPDDPGSQFPGSGPSSWPRDDGDDDFSATPPLGNEPLAWLSGAQCATGYARAGSAPCATGCASAGSVLMPTRPERRDGMPQNYAA